MKEIRREKGTNAVFFNFISKEIYSRVQAKRGSSHELH